MKLNYNALGMLDFDAKKRSQVVRDFTTGWGFLGRWLRVVAVDASRTRHGWHVRLYFANSIPDLILVCIQLTLGSDRKRELLNFRRVVNGEPCWNRLSACKTHIRRNGATEIISEEIFDGELTEKLARIVRGN